MLALITGTSIQHYRRKTPSYTLDPFDEARFTKYRKAIWNQLQKSDVFFRDRFHEVLKCHPGLDPSEFLLRISIGVDPGGAYVTSVAVEGLNDTLRRNNPWEKEIFELQKKERMCPSYEGLGIIALEVMVHNPSGEVSFGMWMGLPLRALPEVALPEGALPEEALPEEVLLEEGELLPENEPPEEGEWSPLEEGIQSYYGLPTDWAYKIADSLSDRQPDYWNFPWLISRDLIRILNVRNPGWRQF